MLGARAGTVIAVGDDDFEGKIQVRWEDDGTESPWWDRDAERLSDDAIKVSDLDEPLGEGTAVRHNGRRGTAAMEPDWDCEIKIRWEDDGTLSRLIKVDELVDVPDDFSLAEDGFIALCRGVSYHIINQWFEKLELVLVEERSCLDDLCTACGN